MGGSAPYWQSFTYNAFGARQTSTVQPTTTTSAAATTTYTYGTACGSPTLTPGPHVLTTTVTKKTGIADDTDLYCANKAGETTSGVAPNDAVRTTTYNSEGTMATEAHGTTSNAFIYDADGELLIKRPSSPTALGTTTLYLGATEVKVTKASATSFTAESDRYYDHAGARVAVRVGKPGVASKLYYLASDHHGTATVQWDASNTPGTRLKRFTDPFGVPRGTSTTFADDKLSLGKPNDSGAGLTHVGAREYDPAIGRFISVDPLLDTTDPSSFNGYIYANNDPVNLSDPSGLQYAAPEQYYGSDGGGPSVPNCVKNCGAYQQRQDEALAQSTDQDWNGIKDNWGRNFSAGAFHSAATLADQGVPQMVTHWHPGDQLSRKFDNKVGADRGSPDYANGGFIADLAMAAIPGGAGLAKDAILGLKSIRAVEEGVSAAKTVAMGRNMGQRVIPYAERNGYGYYRGTPKWVPRKTIARTTSPATLDKVDLWFNNRWINGQMRRGSRIVDIGEPPGYPPSDFYDMELNQVRGYWNYFQDIQP